MGAILENGDFLVGIRRKVTASGDARSSADAATSGEGR